MIISLYAAILALMFIGLTIKTIKIRIKHGVASGDGEQLELRQAIRAHAHFAEYVPFSLLLMLLLEMQNASSYLLHGLGIILIIGRCFHAYSLLKVESYEGDKIVKETLKYRQRGMFLTFWVLGISAVALLITH